MAEALSATEVGKEISEHAEHAEHAAHEHVRRERIISIVEAVILSIVALMAAWSGYAAAKWSTHSSLVLDDASEMQSQANLDQIQATQIRTLDSVAFNAAETAYAARNTSLFRVTLNRMRPGYRPAVLAWIALHPLKNPHAPPDPSYMPQYRIPQETQARVLDARAEVSSRAGRAAAVTADKYVRLTVLLAAVLFLVGIGSRFPARVARYGLISVAGALLIVSVVQLVALPGPPS